MISQHAFQKRPHQRYGRKRHPEYECVLGLSQKRQEGELLGITVKAMNVPGNKYERSEASATHHSHQVETGAPPDAFPLRDPPFKFVSVFLVDPNFFTFDLLLDEKKDAIYRLC